MLVLNIQAHALVKNFNNLSICYHFSNSVLQPVPLSSSRNAFSHPPTPYAILTWRRSSTGYVPNPESPRVDPRGGPRVGLRVAPSLSPSRSPRRTPSRPEPYPKPPRVDPRGGPRVAAGRRDASQSPDALVSRLLQPEWLHPGEFHFSQGHCHPLPGIS